MNIQELFLSLSMKSAFSTKKRKATWEKFYTYLDNGLPMKKIIELTEARAKRDKSPLQHIFSDVLSKYNGGKSFAECMSKYISSEEYILFVAGENKTDTFKESFKLAIELLETKETLKEKIIGELSYPLILIIVNVFLLYGAGKFIIPELASSTDPTQWTGTGALLYSVSLFVNSPWFILVLFLIIFVLLLIVISLPRWCGPTRLLVEKIAPYNIYKEIVGAVWVYTIATLVKSGLTVTDSLHQLAKSSNISDYLFERVERTIRMQNKGGLLSEALRHTGMEFPSKDIIESIEVYEAYPNFYVQLHKLGRQWLLETEKKLSFQLKAARIFFMGLVFMNIGFLVLSLFSIQGNMAQF